MLPRDAIERLMMILEQNFSEPFSACFSSIWVILVWDVFVRKKREGNFFLPSRYHKVSPDGALRGMKRIPNVAAVLQPASSSWQMAEYEFFRLLLNVDI
jgi:hypothetical protein